MTFRGRCPELPAKTTCSHSTTRTSYYFIIFYTILCHMLLCNILQNIALVVAQASCTSQVLPQL